MLKIKLFIVCTALIFFHSCTTSVLTNGRIIANSRFDIKQKTIAINNELSNDNGSHLLFSSFLSQSFMAKGYVVIERFQLETVLHELGLDNSGAVKDTANNTIATYSHSVLKKIGNLYGIQYILFFGRWNSGDAFLRIVDCETAEIVCVITFSGNFLEKFDEHTSDLFVLALEHASKPENKSKLLYLFITDTKMYEYNFEYYGIDEIIYQKEINDKFYIIYKKNIKEEKSQ